MTEGISLAWGIGLLFLFVGCVPWTIPTPAVTTDSTPTLMPTDLSTASPEPSQTPAPLLTYAPSPTATFTQTPIRPSNIEGVIIEQISAAALNQIAQVGTHWVRSHNAVSWAAVEPTEGVRNWATQANLEQELQDIDAKGMQTILSVRVTPSWAQRVTGYSCGPIKPEKLEAFAKFMQDLVARYRVPPYNVKYWEIWNEPDIDYHLVGPTSDWGCWGDQNDPYYGGGYYAQMLKLVYPQIKAADPQSQVLVGGLVLDCDPINPPVGKDCKPAKFLEGILRNNGGPYFDGVSFHAYDYYSGTIGQYGNANWHSAWNTTGPVMGAKVAYLRRLLGQYGQSDKFLMNTETALLCGTSGEEPPCQTKDFANTKAYYLAQSYASALAADLDANLWYSMLGWRASGLLNPGDLAPLPAFEAYRFVTKELHKARFIRRLQEYPGVMGYEFERDGRRIWALWSLDGNSHPVTLPSAPLAAWDALGNSVSPAASLTIDLKPLYPEWKP
ncbi:MAG: cellulase family glycosylhydrolase [Chloroflexota bacterium]|nr:cellulase family glycosylhydrolase [Chloroflexota bacterium]